MVQSYKAIAFKNGEELTISNIHYDSSIGGWQVFSLPNCVMYVETGKSFKNQVQFRYMNTDKDNYKWRVVENKYVPGRDMNLYIKDSEYDTRGGLAFFYHNITQSQYSDTSDPYYGGTYVFENFTNLDGTYNIYVNGKNSLGKNFNDALTDYPNYNVFFNAYKGTGNMYSMTVLLNQDYNPRPYSPGYKDDQIKSFYPNSVAPYRSVRLREVKFPTAVDDLIFFQDLDLYDRSKWDNYQGLLAADKYEQAADYVELADLDYYGAPLFNHIEELIEAVETYALDYMPKVELVKYTTTLPSSGKGQMHYVSKDN